MFFDNFVKLCNSIGKTPSAVVLELGIAKSAVTHWRKRDSLPTQANLLKIADYFDVTVDFLLNGTTEKLCDKIADANIRKYEQINKKSPAEAEDEELNEMLETLKNNPGMRVLFSKTKNATKEDIEKVIKMLDIMKGDD